MTGPLSGMSDADLDAAIAQAQPSAAAPAASPLSYLSNDDLDAAIKHAQANPAPPPDHPVSGPSGSLLTDVKNRLGTAATNAVAGFLSLPNTVAQGIDALGNIATLGTQPPWAQKALESIPQPPGGSSAPMFPDFPTAKKLAYESTGATEYQPETWLGRRTQDVLNGVAAGGPATLAMSGPRVAVETLPALIGGSATGGQAAELFPNHPIIAAMMGAVPGMALANAAVNAPQRIASLAGGGTATEPYGAFQRLGLPTDLAGTATGNPGLSFAEKFAARMPGSEAAVADARSNLVSSWQDKLNDVASTHGSATTPQELGQTLQPAANDWLQQYRDGQSQLWNAPELNGVAFNGPRMALGVHADVADLPASWRDAITGPQNTLGPFVRELQDLGPNASVADINSVRSRLLGVARDAASGLQPDSVKAAAANSLADSILHRMGVDPVITGTPGKMTPPVTEMHVVPGETEPVPVQIGGTVTPPVAGNQAVMNAYQKARDFTRSGSQVLENYIRPIIQAKSPEQAAQFVMQQARLGGSRIQGIVDNLPAAAGDIRAFALRNAAGAAESPTNFAASLAGRRPIYSPEAQAAFFPAGVKQQVADLTSTGKAMQPFEKDLANSPTATHQTRGIARLMAAAELARQGHEFAGTPGAVAGAVTGLMAPNVMGRAAQATALNPFLAALYGKQIPFPAGQNPSLAVRAIAAPALTSAYAPGQ